MKRTDTATSTAGNDVAGRHSDEYVLGPWKFARPHGQWYRQVKGNRWWNRGYTIRVIYGPKIYPSQENG